MSRAIIIAHPSAILRKGLISVLENEINANVICTENIKDLKGYEYLTYNEVAILLPFDFNRVELLHPFRVKIQKPIFIGLIYDENKNPDAINPFDFIFSINSSPQLLIERIKNSFSSGTNEKAEDELTAREKEVLRLIALGHTNKSIADSLFISIHTVISHRKNITEKLGIKTIPGLTVYAIIQNIVNPAEITPDQLL